MPELAAFLVERPDLLVEIADSASAIKEAQALRYHVFCVERRVFAANPKQCLECDEFDAAAQHILVRLAATGEVVATSRVVAARRHRSRLPLHRYCHRSLLQHLPSKTTGEISRFAISKQARARQCTGPLIRLYLLRGILAASQDLGLTHWCALMEPSLIRLLAATGIQFEAIGPLVDAHGHRQPCVARIDAAVECGRVSHPHYYATVAQPSLAWAA